MRSSDKTQSPARAYAVGPRAVVVGRSHSRNCGLRRSTPVRRQSPKSRGSAGRSNATRCLIPVSGYYEWQRTPAGRQAALVLHAAGWLTGAGRSPAFGTSGATRRAVNISSHARWIICEPNDFVAEVHDRMPVLLSANDFEPWLRGEAGLELLKTRAERPIAEMAGVKARKQFAGERR